MAQLVFVDLETTGLDVERHGIIEIGCIFETDGTREKDFQALANPGAVEYSDDAAEVHRIPHDAIAAAPPLEKVLRLFDSRCAKDAILSGWNTKFDEAFLYN
jgi:DNA polymerase III epsilon subunit-like protein